MPVFDPLVFDPDVFDAGPPTPTEGLTIWRNGEPADLGPFNDFQLGSITLVAAAYDCEIGMGSITVPGRPGWVAGDRITFWQDDWLLHTAFVGDWQEERSLPADFQTTYQLMDTNRQLIGRRVVDYVQSEGEATTLLTGFFTDKRPDLTIDTTTWVDTDTTPIPARTYTGDGLMDIAADLIKYTGKTIFVLPTQTEGEYELHFHALDDGRDAGLEITDDPSAALLPYALISRATRIMSAADLKNVLEGRNGIDTVTATDPTSITNHGAGGILWEATLDYQVTEDDLVQIVNTVVTTSSEERPTYPVIAGPMTVTELREVLPGDIIRVTSAVIPGGRQPQRISRMTMTLARDVQGHPVPGLWMLALDLAFPRRQPSALPGFGAQGGDSGRLSTPLVWDNTRVTEDDPGIPVGSTETVTAQLLYGDREMPIPNVTLTWEIEQFDADDNPTSDYSLSASTSDTDISGLATIVVSHDSDTGTVRHRVLAGP